MKASGIVRRIDDLGRVVIPKEIRRTLRIREGCFEACSNKSNSSAYAEPVIPEGFSPGITIYEWIYCIDRMPYAEF